MTLAGLSTYTGITTLSGGTLAVTSMADGGEPSTIGAASAAAGNLVFDGGILDYVSSTPASSDRLFTLTPNGGTILVTGNGGLNLTGTGAVGLTGPGPRQLTLFGSNTGSNTFAASLGDVDVDDPTNLTITGSVNWAMSGNSYSNMSITGGAPGSLPVPIHTPVRPTSWSARSRSATAARPVPSPARST